MDENGFWKIVEGSRGNAERIEKELAKLAPEQIAQFQKLYYERHNRLHRWDIWGAAYVINGGCSDDGFHYFKAWLIGKGRKAYEAALSDPDSLGSFVTDADLDEGCDNESLNYAAEQAYESVTGNDSQLDRDSNEMDVPAGEPWNEESVYDLYPKLSAKFG
jgi:hypothetical protein